MAHDAGGLDAGETVILTLKDRNILEEGDDDPEELEDVLAVRLCHWEVATFCHKDLGRLGCGGL